MRLYQQLGDMFADTSLAAANGNAYSSKTGQCFPFRDRLFTSCVKEGVGTLG